MTIIPNISCIADTVSDLRTTSNLFTSSSLCYVRGYTIPEDGGGGWFEWTNDITTLDDNGITFVPQQNKRTGCWKRVDAQSNPLNILWFGADKTGTIDSINAFNSLIAYMKSKPTSTPYGVYPERSRKIFIPQGSYLVSKPIAWPDAVKVYGEGWALTYIIFSNVVNGVETFTGDGFLVCNYPDTNYGGVSEFADLNIWCSNLNNSGDVAGITMIGGGNCKFSRVATSNWKTHYLLVQSEIILIDSPMLGGGGPNSIGIRICAAGVRGATVGNAANSITVIEPQFNGPSIAVSHEDGVCHRVIGGNYESCQIAQIKSGEAIEYINPCVGDACPGDLFTIDYEGPQWEVACIGLSIRGGFLNCVGAVVRMKNHAVIYDLTLDNVLIANCDSKGIIQGWNQNIGGATVYRGSAGRIICDGPISGLFEQSNGTFKV